MSASKQLRALEPWIAKGSSREVIALVNALPELIVLVEAAEYAHNSAASTLKLNVSQEHAPLALSRISVLLTPALVALEEKLS